MQGRVSVYRVWFGKNATDVGLTSWFHENGPKNAYDTRAPPKKCEENAIGKNDRKKNAILKKVAFFLRC